VTWTFSAVDRVLACPASAALPQVHCLESSEAAERGTGIHAYLRDCAVMGVEAARAALPKKAPWRATCLALNPVGLWCESELVRAEWTVALNLETGEARSLGCDLGRAYPALGPSWLVGTIDLAVAHRADGAMFLYDYKTGRDAPAAADAGQLLAAAVAVARLYPGVPVTVGIVHVAEDGDWMVDEHELAPWDLDAGLEQLRAASRKVEAVRRRLPMVPDVTTGAHCRYCPAFASCPAQTTLAGSLVRDAEDRSMATPGNYGLMSAKRAGEIWVNLQRSRRLLDEVEAALKARCDHDGELLLPDGSTVRPISVTRESIDAERALPVLRQLWGTDRPEAAFPVRITKAELERICAERGDDPKALIGALRSVGAMPSAESTTYRTSKPKKAAAE
jgi:hypothetical protein